MREEGVGGGRAWGLGWEDWARGGAGGLVTSKAFFVIQTFCIFVLLYDQKEQLIDKQFFRIKNSLEYNQQNSEYNITEVIQNLNIILENDKKIESMIIGFVRVE